MFRLQQMTNAFQIAMVGARWLTLALCTVVSFILVPPASAQQAVVTQESPATSTQASDTAADPSPRLRPRHAPAFDRRPLLAVRAGKFHFSDQPAVLRQVQRHAQPRSHYEKATSRVMTFYTGVRLNNSTEILVDIEEAGGAALSTGFGLAGFHQSGHRAQSVCLSKAPYVARAMIHKVFAFERGQD